MPDAFSGFVEGFTGSQEEQYKRNYEQDAARRQGEAEVFKYLLQSQDPEMRALAMSGLFESAQPGQRKKGLAGAMGQIRGGQFYPMVRARMDEMVPDETPTTPTPTSAPGSAAMSTNQAVTPGSQPISPMPPPPMDPEVSEMGGGGPALGPPETSSQAVPMPPPPPPESKWKRRGTGVPTAEEIAEQRERAGLENKVKTITTAILANGGTPEDVKRAVMGMVGAPPTMDATANGPIYADPNDPSTPIPTIRHRNGDITLADGSPLPPGMVGYVKPGTGGALTSTVEDSPETRQQLIAMGADPAMINAGTGGGAWRVQQRADGSVMVQPANQPPPPPAYSGSTPATDANGNPVIIGVPRQGVPGNVIAPAVSTQPTQEQSDATALLTAIDKAIADAEVPRIQGQPRKPLAPAMKDSIARQQAAAGGLPYTTYLEVQRAARQVRRPSPSPTAPKPPETPGGGGSALSMADQIRADLLSRQKSAQGQQVPAPPPPPARVGGPGPVR